MKLSTLLTIITFTLKLSNGLTSVIILPGQCPENLQLATNGVHELCALLGSFDVVATSSKGPVPYYGGMKFVKEEKNGTLSCIETQKNFDTHHLSSISIHFTSSPCEPLLFDVLRQEYPGSSIYQQFKGYVFDFVFHEGKTANLGYYCRNIGKHHREEELAVWATPGFKYGSALIHAWDKVIKRNPELLQSFEFLQLMQHPEKI